MPQSIIDVANAAFSMMAQQHQQLQPQSQDSVLQPDTGGDVPKSSSSQDGGNDSSSSSMTTMNIDERLDAARAILGISPASVVDTNSILQHKQHTTSASSSLSTSHSALFMMKGRGTIGGGGGAAGGGDISTSSSSQPVSDQRNTPILPSNNGLDALAFFATQEQHSTSTVAPSHAMSSSSSAAAVPTEGTSTVSTSCSSSDNDDEFGGGGRTSASGMMPPPAPRVQTSSIETRHHYNNARTTRRFGRPRSVSAPEGMEMWTPRPYGRLQLVLPASILEEELAEASAAMEAKEAELGRRTDDPCHHHDNHRIVEERQKRNGLLIIDEPDEEEEDDEEEEEEEQDEDVEPSELLRRARSRLLEDLSEGSLTGEKGIVTLPHTLAKYKEVYNKNGRIGIYTPAERAAIIARFQDKRTRRVWNKKIRYTCRKNLADSRLRVKGRFVKRATPDIEPEEGSKFTHTETEISAAAGEVGVVNDSDMPDVNDPDAGFCPTEDQPYRRMRRHTYA